MQLLKNVTIHFTTKINDKKKVDVSMTACHHNQKLRNSHDLWSRFAQKTDGDFLRVECQSIKSLSLIIKISNISKFPTAFLDD